MQQHASAKISLFDGKLILNSKALGNEHSLRCRPDDYHPGGSKRRLCRRSEAQHNACYVSCRPRASCSNSSPLATVQMVAAKQLGPARYRMVPAHRREEMVV